MDGEEAIRLSWQSYIEGNKTRFLDEYLEFLRIPSISALPQHAPDVQRAAQWVAERLRQAGMEHVQVLHTGGHPVVYGDWLHAPGKPTALIYGHFDVQPVDPLHLWAHPPFEPHVEGDHVIARGASDNKGNHFIAISAVESFLRGEGTLPINIKWCIEGQEEIGSPQIPAFMARHRDLFACDFVLNSDAGQFAADQPSLGVACRGLAAMDIHVRGANSDLHSGLYGGAVMNANHALVMILDSMRGKDGRIRVEGFYDDVLPLSEEDRANLAALPFDEATYKANLGVTELFGESGYTIKERTTARPTLEVNGMWGGFQGEGIKTVLPNEAHAKITCRLVANQEPQRIIDAIARHVQKHRPPGVKVEVVGLPNRADPYLVPRDFAPLQAARDVLVETYGKEPYYTRTGGSVPILSVFLEQLGAYAVSFGFGLDDERFHAPDEFFRLSSIDKGRAAWCKLIARLGR